MLARSVRACAQRSVRVGGGLSRPLKAALNVRFYSEKTPKDDEAKKPSQQPMSILNDDFLAQAGIDIDSSAAKPAAEGTSADADASDASGVTEEQRQRWKDTAKKAKNVSSTEVKRERYTNMFYIAIFGSIIGGTAYLGRDWDTDEDRKRHPDVPTGYTSPVHIWNRASARFSDIFNHFKEPAFENLLPPPPPEPYNRPLTLVISLEDLLIHSEWTREHGWRTAKRPGLDYFLGYLSQYYEIVVFSSQYFMQIEKPIMKLDPYHAYFSHILAREATRYQDGKIIKDLSLMNRDLGKIVMLDTDPAAYSLQPENAIPMPKWDGKAGDTGLIDLVPFLEWLVTQPIKDVRPILETYKGKELPVALEYQRREALARQSFEAEWAARHHQSGDWAASFLGIQPPTPPKPMMQIDFIRQEGLKGYNSFRQYLAENGEKLLAEEKQREAEILGEQKMTLSKIVTEGMPTADDMVKAAAEKELQRKQAN
ncbi:NIF-domain-containing protein [Nadsonia fulvescens var. elongata DSM 6958]|uniref:Mitochondrial import inner membrane translocase subunit TIM50 n=1 Tax=Nadsonia fulvescens var. elongata DSM 6958 TaxID=857566 RepID=A0A1E3PLQ3_9ASCO|nr:NIF-domain-containing protein [Nadsonia fulvescens var. elongata DSM 6958]